MGAKIASIQAKEILGGRAPLALHVTVMTDSGAVGISTPEAGVSTGTHEAVAVLDGGERYGGLGLHRAAQNVNEIIAPALKGMDVTNQAEIDRLMLELDGTPNKSHLGGNAIVGVSLAAVIAAANSLDVSLYRYIGGPGACTMPIPIIGFGTGGRYRDPGRSRWFKPSYEFSAFGAGSYADAVYWSWQCLRETKRVLQKRYGDAYTSSFRSGTLAGVISHDRELLDAMTESIVRCGYEGRMGIYFDVAADCYYEPDQDRYVGLFSPGAKTKDEIIALLLDFVEQYLIVSLEDPLHEEDFAGIALATETLGIEVVGDDLFTTNPQRLLQGIEAGAANSMVLKITQIGTVSEALAACRLAWGHGYNVHPCGSRGDGVIIGDFAVGLNAGQVRAGDRNRLIDIEQELGSSAVWLDKTAYKGWRK